MKIRVAVSLRFPGEGKSAQGQPGPNTRLKSVVDGNQVNIPEPMPNKVEFLRYTGLSDVQALEADVCGGSY